MTRYSLRSPITSSMQIFPVHILSASNNHCTENNKKQDSEPWLHDKHSSNNNSNKNNDSDSDSDSDEHAWLIDDCSSLSSFDSTDSQETIPPSHSYSLRKKKISSGQSILPTLSRTYKRRRRLSLKPTPTPIATPIATPTTASFPVKIGIAKPKCRQRNPSVKVKARHRFDRRRHVVLDLTAFEVLTPQAYLAVASLGKCLKRSIEFQSFVSTEMSSKDVSRVRRRSTRVTSVRLCNNPQCIDEPPVKYPSYLLKKTSLLLLHHHHHHLTWANNLWKCSMYMSLIRKKRKRNRPISPYFSAFLLLFSTHVQLPNAQFIAL
ncbi:hypothetical protein BDF14DRAFT_1399841 [Spinellus fusiger]|nr:hypothetical protein BDF14DRAFT_1399841 [Spinellus fusiger]